MAKQAKVAVIFNGQCGAQDHDAFKSAVKREDGRYELAFPIHIKGILYSTSVQERWALDKIKHLRTWWKSEPEIKYLNVS